MPDETASKPFSCDLHFIICDQIRSRCRQSFQSSLPVLVRSAPDQICFEGARIWPGYSRTKRGVECQGLPHQRLPPLLRKSNRLRLLATSALTIARCSLFALRHNLGNKG